MSEQQFTIGRDAITHIQPGKTKLRLVFQKDPPIVVQSGRNPTRQTTTFGNDTRVALVYLLGMIDAGFFTLNAGDQLVLMAVLESGYWDRNQNRTVVVQVTDQFDPDWFSQRTRSGYASITVINPV